MAKPSRSKSNGRSLKLQQAELEQERQKLAALAAELQAERELRAAERQEFERKRTQWTRAQQPPTGPSAPANFTPQSCLLPVLSRALRLQAAAGPR